MLIGFGIGVVFLRGYECVDWKEGGLLGVETESSLHWDSRFCFGNGAECDGCGKWGWVGSEERRVV